MKLRYFQGIADIKNHLDDVVRNHEMPDPNGFRRGLLESWGIEPEMIPEIQEEREALRYLLSVELSMARDTDTHKPSQEVITRLFNRHLKFLDEIHNCHVYNVNKHDNPMTRREHKTCTHYLFKFSLPAWVEQLPETVQCFESKYGHLSNEKPLPITFD